MQQNVISCVFVIGRGEGLAYSQAIPLHVILFTDCVVPNRYVSRVNYLDSSKHAILGTQQFRPREFATQIALNMDNAWGILRCIIDTCMKLPDGKYLILKDPLKVSNYHYPAEERNARAIFNIALNKINDLLLFCIWLKC